MEIKLTLKDMPKAKKIRGTYTLQEMQEVPNNSELTIEDSFNELSNTILTNLCSGKWSTEEYHKWMSALENIDKRYNNTEYYYSTINSIIKNENDPVIKNIINKTKNVSKYGVKTENNYEILVVLKQFIGELHKLSVLYVNKYALDSKCSERLLAICNSDNFKNTSLYSLIINDVNSVFNEEIYDNIYFRNIYQKFVDNTLYTTVTRLIKRNIGNVQAKKSAEENRAIREHSERFHERYIRRYNIKEYR